MKDRKKRRRGLTAPEVIVVMVILALLSLLLMMFLPRQREIARLAGCRKNLMQIGRALALYDQDVGYLPVVVARDEAAGPLSALLVELALPDLRSVPEPPERPRKQAGGELAERFLPGFVCASDSNAFAGIHKAPISYRATTGDAPDGRNGAFAPGRQTSLSAIEAADGASFTALFAERLVGDGKPTSTAPSNYAVLAGPATSSGCGATPLAAWQGDAGSSWAHADWRSTLYNHVLTPNAAPSCLSSDGRTACIGSSSGHESGVNVLFADLGVRTFTPRIDPAIWREWARFDDPAPRAQEPRPAP